MSVANDRGIEFYVIRSSFHTHGEHICAGALGRVPAGAELGAIVGRDGATVWFKRAPPFHPDVLDIQPMPGVSLEWQLSGYRRQDLTVFSRPEAV